MAKNAWGTEGGLQAQKILANRGFLEYDCLDIPDGRIRLAGGRESVLFPFRDRHTWIPINHVSSHASFCILRDAARTLLLRTGEVGDKAGCHWYFHSPALDDGREIYIVEDDSDERYVAAVLAVGKAE